MIEGTRSHPGPHREPHAQIDLIYISESSINISHRPAQIGGNVCASAAAGQTAALRS
jgi:hypothetical protein